MSSPLRPRASKLRVPADVITGSQPSRSHARRPRLLIIARSGRALAASARRAGYACDVIDQFADADTQALAEFCRAVPRLDRACLEPLLNEWRRQAPGDGMILPVGGIEADSGLSAWLENYAPVAANRGAVIETVKQPQVLARLLNELDIRHPQIRLPGRDTLPKRGDWLVKQEAADGGAHVRAWAPGVRLATGEYLQLRGQGESMSVLFLADGHDARFVGANRCLHAKQQSGCKDDYRFAGAIREPLPARLQLPITRSLAALVRATGLRGLCGVDLLVDAAGGFQIIEINPRPPATFDLHEHVCGPSLVAAHIKACQGRLPMDWPAPYDDHAGKRVVYVETSLRIPTAPIWPDWVHDRPLAGQRLEAGAPLCTIMACEATPAACRARLDARYIELTKIIRNKLKDTELKEEISA